jgi:hypothetical protein
MSSGSTSKAPGPALNLQDKTLKKDTSAVKVSDTGRPDLLINRNTLKKDTSAVEVSDLEKPGPSTEGNTSKEDTSAVNVFDAKKPDILTKGNTLKKDAPVVQNEGKRKPKTITKKDSSTQDMAAEKASSVAKPNPAAPVFTPNKASTASAHASKVVTTGAPSKTGRKGGGDWNTNCTTLTFDNKNACEVLGNHCPPPLALADHPDVNKFLKPEYLSRCAYCKVKVSETNSKFPRAIVCPGCGPCSDIRYCNPSHVLADALEHSKVCGTQSGRFPLVLSELPPHYKKLYPYIFPLKKSMTAECFRQMVYGMTIKNDGEIENPFAVHWQVSLPQDFL